MKPGPSGTFSDDRAGWGSEGPRTAAASQLPMFDAELGHIFIRMRTLLGCSLWDMARAVGGEPTVIANLEAGAVDALPPWGEVTRLVDAYAQLTGVDPQPILARLMRSYPVAAPAAAPSARGWTAPTGQWSRVAEQVPGAVYEAVAHTPTQIPRQLMAPATIRQQTQPPAGASTRTGGPRAPQPAGRTQRQAVTQPPAGNFNKELVQAATVAGADLRVGPNKARRAMISTARGAARFLLRRAVVLLVLLVLPAMVLLAARSAPDALYAAVAMVPGGAAAPARQGVDQLVALFAPVRDGLKHIEIGDPRLRRTDKLREYGR